MTVASGTRLGHYTIVAPLGAGGMGEVWLAEDTTLKRKVALKVLPAAMAADPDRLARFQREAEVVAALTHPNIVTLHSVEQDGEVRFLTMELVEGQSLDKLIPRGGLPLAQVLDIGVALADALVASHEKGIIHRDLKPANVMLTRDRRVKVLDFGLAQLREEATPNAETATAHRTGEGRVLGTVAYMSPEQAEGRSVDARSDLFALGIVLFEMATGERPFTGDTSLAVLSAILRDTPKSVTELRADLPREFARIVKRCLQKDPEDRYQTAKDVRSDLRGLKADLASGEIASAAAGGRRTVGPALAIVATAVVASALGAWAWSRFGGARPEAAGASLLAFEVGLPEGDRWSDLHPAISPDGQRIAYVAVHDGAPQVYVRTLSEVAARLLPGTTGGEYPFFSPDGRSVAFFADHQLKSTSVEGGPPHVICPAPVPRGGAWGDDHVIVFAAGARTGLSRVAATGGTPEAFTFLDAGQGEISHRFPQVLPGASGVLFTVMTSSDAYRVAGQPAGSKMHATVAEHGYAPQYAQHSLIFVNDHYELVAAPFDPVRLTLTGPVTVQAERGPQVNVFGDSSFNLARDGTLVYLPFEAATYSLAIVTRDGAVQPVPGLPRPYTSVSVSPDGTRIAITIRKEGLGGDIWLGDLGGNFLPLTTDGHSTNPVWSPHADQVAFRVSGDGKWSVVIQPADGRSPAVPLIASPTAVHSLSSSWLPDGRTLLIGESNLQTDEDEIRVVTVGRPEAPRLVLPTAAAALGWFMASPDGRWLAYASDASGQSEVYVTRLPTPGQIWAVSEGGGGDGPVWARSSQELFFQRRDNRVVAVKVTADGPVPGAPRPVNLGDVAFFDTFPDGRFLVVKTASDRQLTRPLVVVLHWTSAALGRK